MEQQQGKVALSFSLRSTTTILLLYLCYLQRGTICDDLSVLYGPDWRSCGMSYQLVSSV